MVLTPRLQMTCGPMIEYALEELSQMRIPNYEGTDFEDDVSMAFRDLFPDARMSDAVIDHLCTEVHRRSDGRIRMVPLGYDNSVQGSNEMFEMRCGDQTKRFTMGPYRPPRTFMSR